MRSKIIVTPLLFLCVATCTYAQTSKQSSRPRTPPASTTPKAPARDKNGTSKSSSSSASLNTSKETASKAGENAEQGENTLLWEITGMGITEPSYLYGTMHVVCEDDAKLSEGLKKAISRAKQVVFEIDMDNMEEMMGMMKYARMNNGLKLSDLVTAEEYLRLEEYFKNNRSVLPFGMMSRFKPYFISAVIQEGMMTCEKKSSIEQIIMQEARNADKPVSGLETLEFQASIFDSIPYEKQAKDLVNYVDSIDKYAATLTEMLDMYRRQDIESMDSLAIKSDPGMEQYMGILLYDRNKRWSIQIPDYARGMPTLFAVGAGHLGGKLGVISLLREMGYTLKPLKNIL